MELYILPIPGEQICNAKHWIQDATHGYKEAIRTKLIKQDPGLSTARRILSRNKDTSEREATCTPSYTPARPSLRCTTVSSGKSHCSSNSGARDIRIPIALSQIHHRWKPRVCRAARFITGEPRAAMSWPTWANATGLTAKPSSSGLKSPRSEDKSGLLARPLLQPQGHHTSSSYGDPDPNACLTKAHVDSEREEHGSTLGTDSRTWRARTASPPSHKTPREGCSASSSSTAASSTQSHLLAVLSTVLLKSVFKSSHWELRFPLPTLIWLHRPPTRFASSANGRGEELKSPLRSCSRPLTNTPSTHTCALQLHPCSNSHQENYNSDF